MTRQTAWLTSQGNDEGSLDMEIMASKVCMRY